MSTSFALWKWSPRKSTKAVFSVSVSRPRSSDLPLPPLGQRRQEAGFVRELERLAKTFPSPVRLVTRCFPVIARIEAYPLVDRFMQLEAQLRILGRSAVDNGLSPEVMRQAVNPVLLVFARPLKHRQYHILQTDCGDWSLTTLARADEPTREKTVIYAFATEKAALDWQTPAINPLPTLEMPVTHLLFQLIALEQVDSIIFLENPRDRDRGREILRSDLQASIQKQLRKLRSIPPDIA